MVGRSCGRKSARGGMAGIWHAFQIPQSFLDGIVNANGDALSKEEKEKMQNPGY